MNHVGRALLTVGILVMATTVAGVILNYSPVPAWDQWYGTVDWYLRAEQRWWPEFWSLHNEHRLLFSRLIFWADMRWFDGVNILSLASNVIVGAALAFVFYLASTKRTALPRAFAAGIALAFCFSWMQSENFTWGFQNEWFAVNLFALLSFHALAASADKSGSTCWFAVALLAAVASSFSMANGCLTWIVLFLMAFALRLSWRKLGAIMMVGAIVLGAYFGTGHSATGSIPHGTLRYALEHHPVDLAHYALAYLGSPAYFAFHRSSPAFLAGLCFAASTAWACVTLWRDHTAKAPALAAFALFLCATAVITGGGRLVLGLANVFQGRYATNALLGWAALIVFWWLNAMRLRPLVHGALAISLAAIVVNQPDALRPNRDALFARLVAGQAVREGVYDRQYMALLWDHPDYLRNVIVQAREQHLTILAPDARGYHNPPARITATARCAGWVDGLNPTETPGMSSASGWIYAPSGQRTVVVTDAAGNVLGNGVVGGNRPDAQTAVHAGTSRLGWIAFYHASPTIRVLGRTNNGYCSIN